MNNFKMAITFDPVVRSLKFEMLLEALSKDIQVRAFNFLGVKLVKIGKKANFYRE